MTVYATRSPLQVLTNTYYMMTEESTKDRRSSARLKLKEEVFVANGAEKSTRNGESKHTRGLAKSGLSARSKRKIDYDEEDNGFKFTRAKSKRAKPTPVVVQRDAIAGDRTPPRSKSPELEERDRDSPKANSTAISSRQNMRQTASKSVGKDGQLPASVHETEPAVQELEQPTQRKQQEELEDSQVSAQATTHESTKIALPFADTPIIRRNKEMRKGNTESRRSSLGMRGRRASSLIDSGTSSALPHDQVETKDFYKHIESTLLEPRRMRQLLMWCGSRALGDKPSFATEDSDTKLAARQIQQELLKDFASRSELSDWFSREEAPASKTLQSNPRNIANLAKIQELEAKLANLRAEQEQWLQLQKPPAAETIAVDPLPALESLSLTSLPQAKASSEAALKSLSSSTQKSSTDLTTSIQQRLETVKTNFELNLDKLLDSVNIIGQHLSSAETLSRRVLGNVARVLDEKDRRAVEQEGSVGTRDTLRALTRILDRG